MAEPVVLRVSRGLSIPLAELTWRATGSGGPGGQHANTTNTRVEVVFDVAGSPSLGPRQRARILERIGASVRVVAADTRSQARNREIALARLAARLERALREPRRRVTTKPPRRAAEARLDDKHRRGDVKRARRRPDADE